jgi:hypothetical protein
LSLEDQHTLAVASLNASRKIKPNVMDIIKIYTKFTPSQYMVLYDIYKNITTAYPEMFNKKNTTILKLPNFSGMNQTSEYFKGLLSNFTEKYNSAAPKANLLGTTKGK